MGNKQTTVEWLFDNLNFEPYDEEEFKSNEKIWEQAKAMEKEQISNGYYQGLIDGMNNSPKEYYEETYGTRQSNN